MRIILAIFAFLLFSNSLKAQLPVSTTPQNRNVLLEYFTATWCTPGPNADKMANYIQAKHLNRFSSIAYDVTHSAFGGPFTPCQVPCYGTMIGDSIENEWMINSIPRGTLNRDTFNGTFSFGFNPNPANSVYDNSTDSFLIQPSYVNISCDATIDTSTRILTVNVEAYFTDTIAPDSMYLNIAIVQDSIIDSNQQGGAQYNPAQVLPNGDYVHLNMFRHSLTGYWGDTIINTTQGSLVQKQYNWTAPVDINGIPLDLSNLKIVAYISESRTKVITACHWPQIPCANYANFNFVDNGNGNYDFTNTSVGSFNKVHWAFGDGTTSTSNNPNHTFAADGVYDVVIGISDTNETNCFSYHYNSINVTSVPSSVPCNAGYSTYLDTTTFDIIVVNSSTGNNVTFYWDFGDGTIDSIGYPTHTYTTNGPHYLCLTVDDGAGCIDTYCDSIGIYGVFPKKSGFTINVRPPGVTTEVYNGELLNNLSIFPNPTPGSINIDLGEVSRNIKVAVINSLGQEVLTKDFASADFIRLELDGPKGIYFLQLQTENGETITKKIVKE